jgi:thiol-disulfide isomerase/thioredoxin
VTRLSRLASVVALVACAVPVAACAGGPIAENTPASSGKGFVGGSASTSYYQPGSRPMSPPVSGTTLAGQRFRLAADRGSVVVLNFWGSWCAPCRAEAPALAALARRFSREHVRFVGVDVRDSVPAAQAFDAAFGLSYPSLRDPGEQIALAFQATVPPAAIPTTLLIDRTGRIAGRVIGTVSFDGLLSLIDRILAGRP